MNSWVALQLVLGGGGCGLAHVTCFWPFSGSWVYVSASIRCCVPLISGLATGMRVGQVGAFVRIDLLASVVIFFGGVC